MLLCQRTNGLGCWRTSPGLSIRNFCSRMNTSQLRIGSSVLTFPPECVFPIPSDRPSLKSASGSAGRHFSRSLVSPNRIPSSPGTAGSLPANLMAPSYVARPASRSNGKRSLSVTPERTPAGGTTALSEPWPISGTWFPISRHRRAVRVPPGRISLPPTSAALVMSAAGWRC